MEKLLVILFMYLLISCYSVDAQESYSVDKWREYIEEMAEATGNEEQAETLYSELSYLSEHPFDLNTATREQLQRLPFLSDNQIEALLAYCRRYGPMLTLYELQGIRELDAQTILLLLPFVQVSGNIVENKSGLSFIFRQYIG